MIRFGLLLLPLLMASTLARAECTREDRGTLAQRGYDLDEIEAVCKLTDDDFPEPAAGTANYCETQDSFCPLSTPAPIGSPCTCATQYGAIPGVAE
jgi:hypothetical protein